MALLIDNQSYFKADSTIVEGLSFDTQGYDLVLDELFTHAARKSGIPSYSAMLKFDLSGAPLPILSPCLFLTQFVIITTPANLCLLFASSLPNQC